jgi:hypothetical protein
MNNEDYFIICVDLGNIRFTINVLQDDNNNPFQLSYNCEKCSGKGCDPEKNIGGMFLFDQCVDGRIITNMNLNQLKAHIGEEKYNDIIKLMLDRFEVV